MTDRRLKFFCVGLLGLGICATSPLQARSAHCLIQSSGSTDFKGSCDFTAERGGSFAVSSPRSNQPFFANIDQISVTLLSPGQAEVRGLTTVGINSRWGPARRSRIDRACWIGTDFKICVW